MINDQVCLPQFTATYMQQTLIVFKVKLSNILMKRQCATSQSANLIEQPTHGSGGDFDICNTLRQQPMWVTTLYLTKCSQFFKFFPPVERISYFYYLQVIILCPQQCSTLIPAVLSTENGWETRWPLSPLDCGCTLLADHQSWPRPQDCTLSQTAMVELLKKQ